MRNRPYINLNFHQLREESLTSEMTKTLVDELLYELSFRKQTMDVVLLKFKLRSFFTQDRSLELTTVNQVKADAKKVIQNQNIRSTLKLKEPAPKTSNNNEAPSQTLKKCKKEFSLTDVPTSLRGFTHSIAKYHCFDVKSLLSIDSSKIPDSHQGRLKRLKSVIKSKFDVSEFEPKKLNTDESNSVQTFEEVKETTKKDDGQPVPIYSQSKGLEKKSTNLQSQEERIETSPVKPRSAKQPKSQDVSLDDLFSMIEIPPRLKKAQSKILQNNELLTVAGLLDIRTDVLGVARSELLGIQIFLRQGLKSPNISAKSVEVQEKRTNQQVLCGNSRAESKPVSVVKESILEDRDIEISGQFSLSEVPKSFRNLILKTAHIHSFRKDKLVLRRLRCCNKEELHQILLLKNYFFKKDNVKNLNKMEETEQIIPQTMPEGINFTRGTLLNEVPLPDEFSEIKEKAELSLGICPTVGDLLQADLSIFVHVECVSLQILKQFYLDNLSDEVSDKDALQGQDVFFSLKPKQFAIVSAPPGCGKTHSIVHKLESHLEQLEQYYDAKKILVLSFTRNAVAELKERLSELRATSEQSNLDLVKVMTFDAFAYRVLRDSDHMEPSEDFDLNIVRVKELLVSGFIKESALLEDVKWLYVDEYQDLVGCRADLVIELTKCLKQRNGAVSLLGDPCQQIMNFQLKSRLNSTTNELFLSEFKRIASRKLVEIELTDSYRFKTAEQRSRVKRLRSEMLKGSERIDGEDFAEKVNLESLSNGSTLLCSRNIDCYFAKTQLTDLGKKVRINQGSERMTAPSWLFDVFHGWKQSSMTYSTFVLRCESYLQTTGIEEWSYLQKMGVCIDDKIQVSNLVSVVEERGGIQPEIDDQTIIISTVHKAKGLQYPHITYLPRTRKFKQGSDDLNEFYVAVTRAQYTFNFLDKSCFPRLTKKWQKALYKYDDAYFLEGIKEIELSSFFSDVNGLNHTELEFVMSGDAEFEVQCEDGKAYITASLPSGKKVKLYRLPRLEHCKELRQEGYVAHKIVPSEFATFVYGGESPHLENLLGPTCFIKVPVFEGFWNA